MKNRILIIEVIGIKAKLVLKSGTNDEINDRGGLVINELDGRAWELGRESCDWLMRGACGS